MATDWSDPAGRVAGAVRDARIPLPAGFSLNPGFAAGLQTSSIVGSFEARSPILPEPARGELYVAEPTGGSTGFGLAIYATAEEPSAGLRLAFSGRLALDSQTGRPTLVLNEAPQLPLERLRFVLGGDGPGPFVTPERCGDAAATAELSPYSAPAEVRHVGYVVQVERGPGGTSCPGPGVPPFRPRLSASSADPRAGHYSALRIRIAREDGEASLRNLALRLPAGLTARLAGLEPGSELGRTVIEAGVGESPARLPGRAYLGPAYGGAPLSVSLVTPAVLGPFDLGTVLVRLPLRLDPRTGSLVIGPATDPLPTFLGGIPLRLRAIDLALDRPELIRNPTGCRKQQVVAVALGADAAGGIVRSKLASPVRATGCRHLPFAPALRLRMLGTTARNGHPGLRAAFVSRAYESTVAESSIALPRGLLFDPARIGGLPTGSSIGRVRAISPLLDEPLHGRMVLARNGEAALPDLVAQLRNEEVEFELRQRLRMGPAGLRIVTERAPDLPISRLVLVIAGGRRGLLVSSNDLCQGRRELGVRLVAHNGKVSRMHPTLSASCPGRAR